MTNPLDLQTPLQQRVVTPGNILPGLATVLGNLITHRVMACVDAEPVEQAYALANTYLMLGQGQPAESIETLELTRQFLNQFGDTRRGAVHAALLLSALESYLQANNIEPWDDNSMPVQGLTDEEEAEFLAFFHASAQLVGAAWLDANATTVQPWTTNSTASQSRAKSRLKGPTCSGNSCTISGSRTGTTWTTR